MTQKQIFIQIGRCRIRVTDLSGDVIDPMIAATPEIRSLVVEKKSRDSGNTLDYKRFPGGSLYVVNAGSRSKSRGMAAKVVLLHEVDAYPVSSQGRVIQ